MHSFITIVVIALTRRVWPLLQSSLQQILPLIGLWLFLVLHCVTVTDVLFLSSLSTTYYNSPQFWPILSFCLSSPLTDICRTPPACTSRTWSRGRRCRTAPSCRGNTAATQRTRQFSLICRFPKTWDLESIRIRFFITIPLLQIGKKDINSQESKSAHRYLSTGLHTAS